MASLKRTVVFQDNSNPDSPTISYVKKIGRPIRPSQFLNNLDLLPLISPKPLSKMEFTNKMLMTPQQSPLSQSTMFSHPQLPRIEEKHIRAKHKYNNSQPDLLKQIDEQMSERKPQTPKKPLNYKNTLKIQKTTTDLPVDKKVVFRNSILLVDLDLGVISKGIIDGQVKPLRRIHRKGTRTCINQKNEDQI